MRLSIRNRNMMKWIYDRSVKANHHMCSLDKKNGVSHGGIQFQIRASVEQPAGTGLVLEVRKDINNFLLQFPFHLTTH